MSHHFRSAQVCPELSFDDEAVLILLRMEVKGRGKGFGSQEVFDQGKASAGVAFLDDETIQNRVWISEDVTVLRAQDLR